MAHQFAQGVQALCSKHVLEYTVYQMFELNGPLGCTYKGLFSQKDITRAEYLVAHFFKSFILEKALRPEIYTYPMPFLSPPFP